MITKNKNMCIVFSLLCLFIIYYATKVEGFILKNKSLGANNTKYNTQGYTTPFIYREKMIIPQPLPISNRWIKILQSNETVRNPTFSFQLEIFPSRDGKLIGSQTFLGGIINGVLSNSNLSELRIIKSIDLLPFDQAAFRKNNNQIELWLHTTKDTIGNIDAEIILNQPYSKESDKLTIWLNGNNETLNESDFEITDNVKLSNEVDFNTQAIEELEKQSSKINTLSNDIFNFKKDKIEKYKHKSHGKKYVHKGHRHISVSKDQYIKDAKKYKIGDHPCGFWHWYSTSQQHDMGLPEDVPPAYPWQIYWSSNKNRCLSKAGIIKEYEKIGKFPIII